MGYKIYKITNNLNGNFYIGKTVRTLEKRFQEHINESTKEDVTKKNSALHLAMHKYGTNNFSISLIEELSTESEMNEREKYWINKYKIKCKHHLYNIANGGDGGNTCQNYTWWNDGIKNYYFSPNDTIPKGLIKGRVNFELDNKDTIWINDGKVQKHIKVSNLSKYPGFQKGMLDRGEKWKQAVVKEISSPQHREKMISGAKKWHEEHPHNINSGSFKKGKTPNNKGKIWIKKDNVVRYVTAEELEGWIAEGWKRGKSSNKN